MSQKKVNKLLKKASKDFEKNYSLTESKLVLAYKRSLDEVRNKILVMYEKYGEPTITEMNKFNRLVSLEQQITNEIRNLNRFVSNTTASQIKNTFVDSYYTTGFAFETGTGVNFGFTQLPQKSIEFAVSDNLWLDSLKNHNAKLLTDIKYELENTLRQNARQEIVSGLSQGKPYTEVAKSIKERFNVTAGRAKTITFTEMHKSYSKGRVEGINTATKSAERLGLKMIKVWRHNAVGVPREDHLEMDGVPADENGIFTLPDGTTTEAPGLTGIAEHDINCHCTVETELEGLDNITLNEELFNESFDKWKDNL